MELSLRGCEEGGEYRSVWWLHTSWYGLHEPFCTVSEAVVYLLIVCCVREKKRPGGFTFGSVIIISKVIVRNNRRVARPGWRVDSPVARTPMTIGNNGVNVGIGND